jgi:thiamine-phosphate pyrophosphorylase
MLHADCSCATVSAMRPEHDPSSARIIDAGLNRVTEALRTAEDICRFSWDLPGLARELKELRHDALHLFAPEIGDRAALAACRDIEEDVGRSSGSPSLARDLRDVAARNIQRAKEALRSLEEAARVRDAETAAALTALRYRLYSAEKGILALAGCRPGGRMADVRLCLVASRASAAGTPLPEAVEAAIAGGAGAVQLREKEGPDREVLSIGRTLRELTARAGIPLIVNDRSDLAVLIGADGLHVGQDDLPVSAARRILGEQTIIGVSVHTREEARRAVREGAAYIGVGAVFPTSTKVVSRTIGPEGVRDLSEGIDIPVFAIGGIGAENAGHLAAVGCRRVAVAAGVLGAGGPARIEEAARAILAALGVSKENQDGRSTRRHGECTEEKRL